MEVGTSLYSAPDAAAHEPLVRVYVGGRPVEPISVTVDAGYDVISSSAVVELAEVPSWLQFRQQLVVQLGYRGASPDAIVVFAGWIEDDGRGYFPLTNTIKASGYLRLCQYQYPSEVTYSSQTDTTIVNDLLDKAGVPLKASILGAGVTLGAVEPVKLVAGQSTWDLINQIDQVTGYITYDMPIGVARKAWAPIPTASAMYNYVQGTNIFSVRRPRSTNNIQNKVVVTGLSQDSTTVAAVAQADNPLIPIPPQYVAHQFRSNLIETTEYAETVALRKLREQNRITEEIELEVPGNPYLHAGATVNLTAAQVGLSTAQPFWIKHVTHSVSAAGYVCRVKLEGGAGQEGYLIPGDTDDPTGGTGGNPVAVIETRVTAEAMDTGGGVIDVYTLNADGSGSIDPDGDPTALTYAWSNDQNATTSSSARYGVNFTAAEWANGPVITLVVTDPDGNTGTSTATLSAGVDTAILQRELYVAAEDSIEASSDGGRTWNTWTPGAGETFRVTPVIAPDGAGYFGAFSGKLYYTEDFLATTPTMINDFGSAISSIWVNEVDANRVSVGLNNGEIWRTVNASAGVGATWAKLKTYTGQNVYWIIESAYQPGQYWVGMDNEVRTTFDDFANDGQQIAWTGANNSAVRIALSNFSNYGGTAIDSGGEYVKRDDGTVITFPSVSPAIGGVHGLAHHIRDDILYAAEKNTGDTRIWQKAAGATEFTLLATVTGAGDPHDLNRDGDSPLVLYLSADAGLYKTVDGGTTWYRVRDYSAAGLTGFRMGYGSASWQRVTTATVVSDATATTLSLWNGASNDSPPSGWTDIAFDDGAWANAVDATPIVGTPPDWGATAIWPSDPYTNSDEAALFRKTFTLSDGIAQTATLTYDADGYIIGLWINGIHVAQRPTSATVSGGATISLDPNLLITGGTNVIAMRVLGFFPTETWAAFKLVVT